MTSFIDGGFARELASSDSNQPYMLPVCPRILRLFRIYDFPPDGARDNEACGVDGAGGDGDIDGKDNNVNEGSILASGNIDEESNDVDKGCIPVSGGVGGTEPWLALGIVARSVFAVLQAVGKHLLCRGTGFKVLRSRGVSMTK